MHYTVMVISAPEQNIEDQLAPFDENLEVEPYIEKTKADIIAEVHAADVKLKEEIETFVAEDDGTKDVPYIRFIGDRWKNSGRRYPTEEDVVRATENAERSDEEAYAAYRRDEAGYLFDDDGNELSTYNPNSKWDWYSIGGRWDGGIPTKDGRSANQCKISEIDCSIDKDSDAYKHAVRFWEVVVDGETMTDEEREANEFFHLYSPEYYKSYYKDAEDYARRVCEFGTYAVLDSEGVWHEPGEMGWFSSTDTPESKEEWDASFTKLFVEDQPDDYIATLVDCHI